MTNKTNSSAAPDWRGLCQRMADELDLHRQLLADDRREAHPLAVEARAALAAEPVATADGEAAEGPTDEELDAVVIVIQSLTPHQPDATTHYLAAVDQGREILLHCLARWSRQPAPPAEGEVAELVDRLRRASDGASAMGWEQDSWTIARAADLLEQRHPTPVPVAERLPGAEDCLGRPTEEADAGWCWTYSAASEAWLFQPVVFPRPYPDPPRVTLNRSVTHWLPHHALPLPSGEVES